MAQNYVPKQELGNENTVSTKGVFVLLLTANMLTLKSVQAGYGRLPVLKGVSVHVRPGEVVTLIGGNGAGKSTILRTICGLLRARKGTLEFAGQDLTLLTPERIVALGLVLVPEGRRVFRTLSVTANLELGAYTRRDRIEVRRDPGGAVAALPHAEGTGPAGSRHLERRRAADPGHGPGSHGPAPSPDAG